MSAGGTLLVFLFPSPLHRFLIFSKEPIDRSDVVEMTPFLSSLVKFYPLIYMGFHVIHHLMAHNSHISVTRPSQKPPEDFQRGLPPRTFWHPTPPTPRFPPHFCAFRLYSLTIGFQSISGCWLRMLGALVRSPRVTFLVCPLPAIVSGGPYRRSIFVPHRYTLFCEGDKVECLSFLRVFLLCFKVFCGSSSQTHPISSHFPRDTSGFVFATPCVDKGILQRMGMTSCLHLKCPCGLCLSHLPFFPVPLSPSLFFLRLVLTKVQSFSPSSNPRPQGDPQAPLIVASFPPSSLFVC